MSDDTMSSEDIVKLIRAELKAHPAVDEAAAAEALKSIACPEPVAAPSDEGLKAFEAECLEKAKAMGPHPDHAE